MGEWANKLANGDAEIRSILDGVPGPLCHKIDQWALTDRTGHSPRDTKLGRRQDYDDLDVLYAEADSIADERDAAISGLEECRTALERLRAALEETIELYRAERDKSSAVTK